METNDKFISDENEFLALLPLVSKFPRIHNAIKSDFKVLLEITESHKNDPNKYSALGRVCIRNLFSLIEADIYYYNLFDSYPGYEDRHGFFVRFKKTFKQICKTWNREVLQQEYFQTKLSELKELKEIRDKLTHPKQPEDIIQITEPLFIKVKRVFSDYDSFITTIMSNFFISTTIPIERILPDLFKNNS
jgi:hypothetical protein